MAACGGGGGGVSPSPTPTATPYALPAGIFTAAPADIVVASATVPPPYNPVLGTSQLGASRLQSLAPPGTREAFVAHRRAHANAPANDHEAAGIFIFGNGPPYNAVFNTQTAYEGLQNPLTLPSGTQGAEQIYAPTTHMGWGNCLETSSFYDAGGLGTAAYFTIFNFCTSPIAFSSFVTIDSAFLRQYVRIGADGLPFYAVETFTPDATPSAQSTWYVVLYDFVTNRYDLMGSASHGAVAFSASSFGWTQVEPYDALGPCPKIAPAEVTAVALHNTSTGSWDALQATMAGGAYTYFSYEAPGPNPCFTGDSTGPASMTFLTIAPNSRFIVTSPSSP